MAIIKKGNLSPLPNKNVKVHYIKSVENPITANVSKLSAKQSLPKETALVKEQK